MTDQQRKLVLLMLLATVILCGSFYFYETSSPPVANSLPETMGAAAHSPVPASDVFVYVSGAVNKPGVFKLPVGSRIVDAVSAAGGFVPGADESRVNLAALLKDELQVHVPYLPLPVAASGSAGVTKAAGKDSDKVNINLAEKAELDRLPGVGPALAERIVEYRNSHGLFRDVTDLKKVPGIGDAKFQQLKDHIML
ncbi:MAG TPA: ComEA family DNA-binding protein [Patescibacteria group bacterium]|nr:ComEA family DNA-binding protein [Patescibacteria group bacterium]